MKFESPFNKIKKPLVLAGALTVASFLPNEIRAQGALSSIPPLEIKNSEGVLLDKKLKEIRSQKLDDISVYVALLEKDIDLLSNEKLYKENVKTNIELQKNLALGQIDLVNNIKSKLNTITFYQKDIEFFIHNYLSPNNNPELEPDEVKRDLYEKLYSLKEGSKNLGYTKFDLWKEIYDLVNKGYQSNLQEFKKDFSSLLNEYVFALEGQFIEPFDTKEEETNYLENRWIFRENVDTKVEEFNFYKKVQEFLSQEKNLNSFKNAIIEIYKQIYRHVSSDDYLNKLKVEFGSPEKAKELQNYRLGKLGEANVEFEIDTVDNSRFYPNQNRIIYNLYALVQDYSFGSGPHEFNHLLENAGLEMSQKAKDLYQEGWIGDQEFLKLREKHPIFLKDHDKEKDLNYFKTPTELNARKKNLELYMEKSGIKKYGEKMTEAHYQKLMELFKQGKLDRDCSQLLILMLKEKLIDILNTIAEVSSGDDVIYLV